jgi:hypothetical protein
MEAGKIYSDTGIITNNVNNDAKDLFEKSTGSITLENNWMHYEIIIEGQNLSSMIGVFCWPRSTEHQTQRGSRSILTKSSMNSPNRADFLHRTLLAAPASRILASLAGYYGESITMPSSYPAPVRPCPKLLSLRHPAGSSRRSSKRPPRIRVKSGILPQNFLANIALQVEALRTALPKPSLLK